MLPDVKEVRYFLDEIERRAEEMCKAERLHREGKLPKRVCHCDTKVNNMMFDESGNVLCVIDLDTVMPSFVFSDFGDFLRSGANTGLEDDKDLANVNFNMEIFKAFTKGYLESAKSFLLPVEIENLPYAAALFPYMQCVRFLADYINGDTYYKIQYPEHNLVRTKAQFKLLQSVEEHTRNAEIHSFMHLKRCIMAAMMGCCVLPLFALTPKNKMMKELDVKKVSMANIPVEAVPALWMKKKWLFSRLIQ